MRKIKPKIEFFNMCKPVYAWEGWVFNLLPTISIAYDGTANINADKEFSISFIWLFFSILLIFEKEN